MLAEPPDQVQFVWYLNSSLNERRVLFTGLGSTSLELPTKRHQQELDDNLIDVAGSGREPTKVLEMGDNRTGADFETMRPGPQNSLVVSNQRRRAEAELAPVEQSQLLARRQATRARQVATSQLELDIDSQFDYGRLYCVAKNAIGEQKRACFYTIEPNLVQQQQEQQQQQLDTSKSDVTRDNQDQDHDHEHDRYQSGIATLPAGKFV